MKLFAKAGDQVTCENGHIICTVSRNIFVADDYVPTHLINWTQPEPKTGSLTDVKCAQCGEELRYTYAGPAQGTYYEFVDACLDEAKETHHCPENGYGSKGN